MGLDIRLPIGLMFSLIGALLVVTGLISDARSLNININLVWGLVLVVFGVFMLVMAWRASKNPPTRRPNPQPARSKRSIRRRGQHRRTNRKIFPPRDRFARARRSQSMKASVTQSSFGNCPTALR